MPAVLPRYPQNPNVLPIRSGLFFKALVRESYWITYLSNTKSLEGASLKVRESY